MTTDTTPETTPERTASEPTGYTVPPDATHVDCGYCGAPFADEELLALHHGLAHEDRLTDAEREAFESAYTDEDEDLKLFRLKAVAVLVALYFVLLMAYSVFG